MNPFDGFIPNVRYIYDPIGPGLPNYSGLSLRATSITIHENGNPKPGADALAERTFVHSGGGDDTASYHFAVSSVNGVRTVVQLLPLNIVAWHAGDGYYGEGNRTSVPIEHCQWGDFNDTLWLGAALVALLRKAPERFPGGQTMMKNAEIYQHNHWSGKHCPQYIRERGLWNKYLSMVREHEMKLTNPVPLPIGQNYRGRDTKWNNMTWRAIHRIMVARAPGVAYSKPDTTSPVTRTFQSGEQFEVYYVGHGTGPWWYYTSRGDFISEGALTHRVRVYRRS